MIRSFPARDCKLSLRSPGHDHARAFFIHRLDHRRKAPTRCLELASISPEELALITGSGAGGIGAVPGAIGGARAGTKIGEAIGGAAGWTYGAVNNAGHQLGWW